MSSTAVDRLGRLGEVVARSVACVAAALIGAELLRIEVRETTGVLWVGVCCLTVLVFASAVWGLRPSLRSPEE